jgi:16S rRNA (guanine527-N7)-methyltransferase
MESKRIRPDRRKPIVKDDFSTGENKLSSEKKRKPVPSKDKKTERDSTAKIKKTPSDSSASYSDRKPAGVSTKTMEKPAAINCADNAAERMDPRVGSGNDSLILSGAAEISVPLSAEHIRAFGLYARMLKEWNEKMNLTNITDDQGIALRHFIDSLTLIPHLEREMKKKNKKSLSLIDVGTGAGFPGIPLKVAMPALEVTLLDSLRKRVGFLDAVCRELALTGIVTLHGRAEDIGKSKQHRETFDVATARAVASLPVLCEYCMPFIKVGGIFLAMKGYAEEEVKAAQKAVVTLGGTIEDHFDFYLPGTDMKRSIIQIRKLRATPPKYPRQAGKPEKEPIL